VLNVHAPTEDNIDNIKDSFYIELEQVVDKFPKYCNVYDEALPGNDPTSGA
jgi:hypothetical protein